jgi:predicted MFS family arabinose efflux permease
MTQSTTPAPRGRRRGTAFTPTERRATVGLASIYATRMLGLFLVLPVFTLLAHDYPDYSPALAGLAIGAYGLTQSVLQIPFGMLSDRWGRKPVITGGLLVFAAGSVLAALADSLLLVLLGRALQGAGAIAAAVLALTADLTREEQRTKAMAVIGMSIGLSFSLALVAGPIVGRWAGLPGIFWLTAALALAGLAILHLYVPTPVQTRSHRDAEPVAGQLLPVLRDPQLLRLNAGILMLHLVMTATFVALPLALRDHAGLASERHWMLYLGVLVASVALMVPFIIHAERHRRLKQVFVGAVLALGVAQLGMVYASSSLAETVVLLILYFTAFNLLEASLPSLVSKFAPPERKGTAMGIYSTSQFLGAFLGGAGGGWMLQHHDVAGVFALGAAVAGIWFMLAAGMRSPRYLTSHMIHVGAVDAEQAARLVTELTRVRGVAEAVVIPEDGVAYLKVDSHALDREALAAFAVAQG